MSDIDKKIDTLLKVIGDNLKEKIHDDIKVDVNYDNVKFVDFEDFEDFKLDIFELIYKNLSKQIESESINGGGKRRTKRRRRRSRKNVR